MDGFFEFFEAGLEGLYLGELQGEGHGVAGSAQAEGDVGSCPWAFGEDGNAPWQEGLGLLSREAGGLLVEAIELPTENRDCRARRRRVDSLTPESRAAWVRVGARATARQGDLSGGK